MTKKHLTIVLMGIAILCSCKSVKDIAYMQDAESIDGMTFNPQKVKIQPADKISIIVNCERPDVAMTLNLPYITSRLGQTSSTGLASGNMTQGVSGYTVQSDGSIDFPVVGKIQVAGLSRGEAAELVKQKIIASGQDNRPTVTVEFMNLVYSVLGEVKSPGRYSIDRDYVTILDAISMAGDLNITGQRKDIMVLRTENGKQNVYNIDITSGTQMMNSPAYYLRQDDVVYVKPNKMRSRQSTLNGNTFQSTSFWISLTSLATSIIVLIKNW